MKTVLVVDDDKSNLILAQNVLGKIYKVIEIPSGMMALRYLESHVCDLILLDINMPEMDGFEVMEKIRENGALAQIPIIFLTADNDADTETHCLEAGAMDFIVKPFVPAVMISRIERILELEDMRRQLTNKLEEKIEEVNVIRSRSDKDVLTGLWNRAYTEKKINELLQGGSSGALFMIDMDNFKAINDNYGHLEGDRMLMALADTMRKHSVGEDVLCRIGGDEFVMFADGHMSKSSIGKLAGDIIADICDKIKDNNYKTDASVSIGIAQAPEDGADFNALYNAADKALYLVKQNGKNSYHFYSEQKEDEDARGKVLVDLDYLKAIMDRADSGRGAYQLDLTSFHHVYNFIHRFVERSGQDVQTVLFTVNAENTVSAEEINDAIELLEQAIYNSLRRVDVSTRYSNKQVIVILMDANTDNGNLVAKRILEYYEKLYTGGRVSFTFDIAKIEGGVFSGGAKNGQNNAAKKTILVVDDDPTNLNLAKSVLDEFYKIIAVPSGRQALRYLENNTCDLILLDINMPEMDGFEVLQKIRAGRTNSPIPVIFLTAENNAETENKCLGAGAIDYIAKPFAVNVLRSRINRTLELEDLRKNLQQKVEEKTEHINYIRNMTVLGMATMVESRDNSTGGHIMRTGDVVKVFTKYLYKIGYISDVDYLKKIVRAAPMHDLGKIAIDDRILRKNGKYLPDEYGEMKRHSAEGAKVVEKMLRGVDEDDFVDIAVNVAKSHHERWDGKGYPEGKAGDEIPTEARIMALADVFDALVSPRCYKEPFSYDKAFSIIEESLGTQFDPELGKYFMECRGELEELYNHFM